jgi:serine/threonine protein phosphatase PrpC
VVADGMGGHENGALAAGMIADAVRHAAFPPLFEDRQAALLALLHASNAAIFAEAEARGRRMGSTVVALLIEGERFMVVWAGDSRIYLLRGGQLVQITSDHTQVQAMVDAGQLDAEAAIGHPYAHVLARAMGVQANVVLDVVADSTEPGDMFLLCSDGLSGQIDAARIAALLAQHDPEAAAQALVNAVLEGRASDNVTVIVLRVTEPTLLVGAMT